MSDASFPLDTGASAPVVAASDPTPFSSGGPTLADELLDILRDGNAPALLALLDDPRVRQMRRPLVPYLQSRIGRGKAICGRFRRLLRGRVFRTRDAAAQLGISVQDFVRLARRAGLVPVQHFFAKTESYGDYRHQWLDTQIESLRERAASLQRKRLVREQRALAAKDAGAVTPTSISVTPDMPQGGAR